MHCEQIKRSAELRYNYHVNIVCTNKINWAFTLIKTFWPPWYIKPSLSIFHVFRMSLGGGPVALFLFLLFVWVPKNALWIIQIVALIFPSVLLLLRTNKASWFLVSWKGAALVRGAWSGRWQCLYWAEGKHTERDQQTNKHEHLSRCEGVCLRTRTCVHVCDRVRVRDEDRDPCSA